MVNYLSVILVCFAVFSARKTSAQCDNGSIRNTHKIPAEPYYSFVSNTKIEVNEGVITILVDTVFPDFNSPQLQRDPGFGFYLVPYLGVYKAFIKNMFNGKTYLLGIGTPRYYYELKNGLVWGFINEYGKNRTVVFNFKNQFSILYTEVSTGVPIGYNDTSIFLIPYRPARFGKTTSFVNSLSVNGLSAVNSDRLRKRRSGNQLFYSQPYEVRYKLVEKSIDDCETVVVQKVFIIFKESTIDSFTISVQNTAKHEVCVSGESLSIYSEGVGWRKYYRETLVAKWEINDWHRYLDTARGRVVDYYNSGHLLLVKIQYDEGVPDGITYANDQNTAINGIPLISSAKRHTIVLAFDVDLNIFCGYPTVKFKPARPR